MKAAEMVIVGDELLDGDIIDTNSTHISKRLLELGIKTRRKVTVPDKAEEISDAVTRSLERVPDYLIVIGGLGFTPDDVTREGLASALGKKVVVDEQALNWLKQRLKHFKRRELTETRKKFANILEGSRSVRNPVGAACGFTLREGQTHIVVMPGPPREVESMLEQELMGKVFSSDEPLHTVNLFLEGSNESELMKLYRQLEQIPSIIFGSYPKQEGIHVKIQGEDFDIVQKAKKLVEKFKKD
ncbi:MAG: competence damage-inducible protein A [Nitrososphaeria archaeon]|nr:competence damage-inducible protein A [Nitrososphaeria archaeon]NIQ32182.1 competence damage-inducible protein A [Nitrososphaeria archaeon]